MASGNTGSELIERFGAEPLTAELIERLERITQRPAHPLIRRGFVVSHRSLSAILDLAEKKQPFYIYTGRGPSSDALHIGHVLPFLFAKYLQEAFRVPLVIQLSDDEKHCFRDLSLEESHRMALENAKDILALGFDPKSTFVFCNCRAMGQLYPTVVKIQKLLTLNQVRASFGLDGEDNVGKYAYPAVQAAPCFSQALDQVFGGRNVPVLVPCGLDQDPFFRLTRDIAHRLGAAKPAVVHSRFLPGLLGVETKMSSSEPDSAIFMTDDAKTIERKIRQKAFSGGRASAEEHRRLGADLAVDVSVEYLRAFLESDDEFARLTGEYASGRILTGQLKQRLIELLVRLVDDHKARRSQLTDERVAEFFRVRPLL